QQSLSPAFKDLNKIHGRYLRWFKLEGVSFTILSDIERDLVLKEWEALITSVKSGVVLARRKVEKFRYGNHDFPVSFTDFYLGITEHVKTSIPYFRATEAKPPSRPGVRSLAGIKTLYLIDGTYARVLVAYRYPSILPESFLYSLFSDVWEIALVFKSVPRSRALSLVESAIKRKSAIESPVEVAHEINALRELGERVLRGSDLVEFYLIVVLRAPDLRVLNDVETRVRTLLKGFGVETDTPPIQRELYEFRLCGILACVEKTYTDTTSLKPLFFLVDEEMLDVGGVFLGFSGSGSPVVLDLWSKPNLNFVVLGVTGSGKSMSVKLYLKRLRERVEGVTYVGVDPESEYTKIARHIKATPLEISENQDLGLDPIRLLQSGYLDIGQVSDVLSEVYAIPKKMQGVLRKELFVKGDVVSSIEEFVTTLRDPVLRRLLEGAIAPPDIHVFRGTPPKLSGNVVFGLKSLRSKRLKILISTLISTYAYNTLLARTPGKSVFFVDEAWLFMETPSILGLFENLARRGRKHGVVFMYVTQRAEDLARSTQGRTILEQSATVLLMRQEPEGRDACRKIYKLSEAEADYLTQAPVGSGILKAGRKRITIQVVPTPEELEVFSTSAR
ncbi:MAG: VirB4 family type IV secretion system protein, partial [Zestosphaera sp.]